MIRSLAARTFLTLCLTLTMAAGAQAFDLAQAFAHGLAATAQELDIVGDRGLDRFEAVLPAWIGSGCLVAAVLLSLSTWWLGMRTGIRAATDPRSWFSAGRAA